MNLDDLLGIDPDDPVQMLAERLVEADERLLDDLIKRRLDSGLTVAQVAERIGVTETTVAKLENGERDPRLSLLRLYALAVRAEVRHSVAPSRQAELARLRVNEVLERQKSVVWSALAHREHSGVESSEGIVGLLELIGSARGSGNG
jgi:transcriptional regulator with XRE-family HTH domain